MPAAPRATSPSVLDAARALAPEIRAAADRIEQDRRVPPDLVGALADAGVFRLCVARAYGGLESEVAETLTVLEAVAEADGSTGWIAAIGVTTGLVSGYLAPEFAHEIYGTNPRVVTGGVFAPKGKAIAVDGGYRVRGRWSFASGCQHCAWLLGGSVVFDGDKPRLLPRGIPDSRMMLFPAAAVEIIDTWTVSGLRGTGSHDIAVADVFVPEGRSASLITDQPRESGLLYRFPAFGLLALAISAVALGIARRALDELRALAAEKTPTGGQRLLAERPTVQAAIARAEAGLRAARAFLFEAVGNAWHSAQREGLLSTEMRTALRLAATHATESAARAVDVAYEAGGGTSIYATSPLQRCFRDVHVVTQHLMVSPATWELTGRLLLGLETDTAML
jgi:alkylation response protein AidB-like acyl-CoA dehydrogenase